MSHQPLAAAQEDIGARKEWRPVPIERADVLRAIDEHRISVVESIVELWGAPLTKSNAYLAQSVKRADKARRTQMIGVQAEQPRAQSSMDR